MVSFSAIYMVLATICVDLLSAESQLIVIGHVGSTAVLPCVLPSVDTETQHIKWNIKSETVFERWGEETYDGEGYVGRVDVPEDELRKGNCSLVLRGLTLTDAAIYKSYRVVRLAKRSVKMKRDLISRVELSVINKRLSHEETNENTVAEAPLSIGYAGMCPHQLIMVLSLLSSLRLYFF